MDWSLNDAASATEVTALHEIEIIMYGKRLRTQIEVAVAYF
jgi:hypothetical protein